MRSIIPWVIGIGRRLGRVASFALLGIGAVWLPLQNPISAQAGGSADLILSNGKIVTVDERFGIAEAVAIRGERVLAVGTNQDIRRLAGPSTRTIDLRGRTVLPGLIDNHLHLLRSGTNWKYEVRWDGVDSRKSALDLLRARSATLTPGDWIYILGGWSPDQFADDPRPFTREELDAAVPNHPVFLQVAYYEAYLNSRGLQTLGVDPASTQPGVVRDAAGLPTGRVSEEGVRGLLDRLPTASGEALEASTLGMIRDLNRMGLTAVGSVGCDNTLLKSYRSWADQGRLNMRVFCITMPAAGAGADLLAAQIGQMKVFDGDHYINHIAFGENVGAAGLQDPMFAYRRETKSQDLTQWREVIREVAKAGLPLHVHVNFRDTIDVFLDQIEAVSKEYPQVRNLRWVFAHFNQPTAEQLERMKRLGIYAAVHPWAVSNGGINLRHFGDSAYDMAPLRVIQNSAITWGFGSDGSRANQILPFETLSWAVTGKMVGGRTVLRQPISREEALIAHTRKNAYFLFQEDNLGSIQPGKLADLVVIDRDYLTVPVDQIKDITPVITLVAGRIVYQAANATN